MEVREIGTSVVGIGDGRMPEGVLTDGQRRWESYDDECKRQCSRRAGERWRVCTGVVESTMALLFQDYFWGWERQASHRRVLEGESCLAGWIEVDITKRD